MMEKLTMNDYEQKQEARRARYGERAASAERAAGAAFQRARREVEHIPLGQPVLIGHHSERGHRAALRRHDRAMDRGCAEHAKAAHYAAKADAVGTAGISSDDPAALEKLRAKLAALERRRELMKRVNQAWRKGARSRGKEGGEAALRALQTPDGAAQFTDAEIAIMSGNVGRYSWITAPFEDYALSNLGANIKRVRTRVEQLERRGEQLAEAPDTERLHTGEGWYIETRPADLRIALVFAARPPREVTQFLRGAGWRWAPTHGAWLVRLHEGGQARAHSAAAWLQAR
jgi:hypothetical protein